MRRFLVAFLSTALCTMCGRAMAATGDQPLQSQRPDSLLSLLRSSACVQSFVLQGPAMITNEEGPNLHGFRIIGLGPIADRAQVEELCRLVEQASAARCGEPNRCMFDPGFGFRFSTSGEPLDVLIATTCDTWLFMRGGQSISSIAPETDCINTALSELMRSIFKPGDRK